MPQRLNNPNQNTPTYCHWTGANTDLTQQSGSDLPAELPPGLITRDTQGLFISVATEAASPNLAMQLCCVVNGRVVWSDTIILEPEAGGRRSGRPDLGGSYLTRANNPGDVGVSPVVFDVRGVAQAFTTSHQPTWYLCCQDLTAGGVAYLLLIVPINKSGGRPDA